MAGVQDQVHSMDVTTMIMYNRAMTQLGLCAFRSGLIQESHTCLAELYGSNRIRELLAQGMSLNRCAPAPCVHACVVDGRARLHRKIHIFRG